MPALRDAGRAPRQRARALLAPPARSLPPLPRSRIRPLPARRAADRRRVRGRGAGARARTPPPARPSVRRRCSSPSPGIDLEHRIVPNRIVVPAAVYGVVGLLLVRFGDTLEFALAGAGRVRLFLLLAALAYPAGMGMGDVKLAGVMGLFLGLAVVPAMFAAFLAGSLLGVVLIVRFGARARKMGVPFGPFLAAGGLIALLVGPELVALYADTFLT
ncbi:MAG: A24 family peptidase [Thermoleophilaceae bacterium]